MFQPANWRSGIPVCTVFAPFLEQQSPAPIVFQTLGDLLLIVEFVEFCLDVLGPLPFPIICQLFAKLHVEIC